MTVSRPIIPIPLLFPCGYTFPCNREHECSGHSRSPKVMLFSHMRDQFRTPHPIYPDMVHCTPTACNVAAESTLHCSIPTQGNPSYLGSHCRPPQPRLRRLALKGPPPPPSCPQRAPTPTLLYLLILHVHQRTVLWDTGSLFPRTLHLCTQEVPGGKQPCLPLGMNVPSASGYIYLNLAFDSSPRLCHRPLYGVHLPQTEP